MTCVPDEFQTGDSTDVGHHRHWFGYRRADCGHRIGALRPARAGARTAHHGRRTQTFKRHDWSFATGVHYVSGVGTVPGPDGQFGRLLHWLTGGALQFASCGNPYDIVRLPGFEFGIEHPQAAFRKALGVRFPAQQAAIEAWFEQLDAASQSARSLLVMRGRPGWPGVGACGTAPRFAVTRSERWPKP